MNNCFTAQERSEPFIRLRAPLRPASYQCRAKYHPCPAKRTELYKSFSLQTHSHIHTPGIHSHNSVFSQAKKMSLSLSTQDKTCMRNLLLPWQLQLLELVLLRPNLCLSEVDGRTPTDFSKSRIWLLCICRIGMIHKMSLLDYDSLEGTTCQTY